MGFKAISFDCYGTLIDWESGIVEALSAWAGRHGARFGRAELLAAFSDARTEGAVGPSRRWRIPKCCGG